MSKLTNRVFGRRFWAVLVAIIMVVQLLPVAAIADYVEQTDEDGAIVDFVSNRGYDGGIEVDTVEPAKGEGTVAPIGNAGGSFEGGEEIDPILPVVPVTGDEEPEEPADPAEPEEPAEEPEEPAEEPEEPVEPEEPEEPAEEPEEPAEEPAQAESFTVAFAAEDGTALLTVEVEPGQAIGELPEAPAKYGYTFLGWFDANGNKVTAETVVYGTMVVTARYEMNMPTQGFSATTSTGIKVYAFADEGVFPAGTTMRVQDLGTPVAMNLAREMYGDNVTDAAAVDITFFDENGNEVQPLDQQKVLVRIVLNRELEGKNFNVVHFDEKGTFTEVGKANASNASFETGSFSIYIVVGQGEDARLKVVFHRADNTTSEQWINKRQLDKINQYIFDPGTGTLPDGTMFKGWTDKASYTEDDADDGKTIADVRTDITTELNKTGEEAIHDGDELHYYAMIFKPYTVTYMDERGIMIQTDIKFVPVSSTEAPTYDVTLTYVPYPTEEEGVSAEFIGWQQLKPVVPGETVLYKNQTITLEAQEYILKAYTEKGHWLSFDENLSNAPYTEPQFIAIGGKPTAPAVPVRSGYTFDGWYTEDYSSARDGQVAGSLFDFNQVLTANTTVYAKWNKATTADYSVVIWFQNKEGNGYNYSGTTVTVQNATVGNNTYQISAQGSGNSRYARIYTSNTAYTNYNDFFGFHLNRFDAQKPVAAEGTTVINVYYDRNEITYIFQRQGNTQTFSGLYGSAFTQWPDAGTGYVWSHGGNNFPLPLVEYNPYAVENNPGTTTSFTFTRSSYSSSRTLYVYKQTETGTWDYTNDYLIATAPLQSSGYWIPSETYIGFTLDSYRVGTSGTWRSCTPSTEIYYNNNLYLRYTRNQNSITYSDGIFVNGGGNPVSDAPSARTGFRTISNVYYEADINSSTYNFKPTLDGFVFMGWYDNELCAGDTYVFDKMPEHNVTLYAKWGRCEYTIMLHANDDDSPDDPIQYNSESQAETFWVDEGEKIGNVGGKRNYYDLVGWYSDAAMTHSFDFDSFVVNRTMINKYGKLYTDAEIDPEYPLTIGELNLYAKWRSKLIGANGIKLEYVPGDGTCATDDNTYVDQAKAVAIGAATPNNTTDYVFSHWVVQKWNGTAWVDTVNVFPGDTFDVIATNAKVEDITPTEDDPSTKKYTIRIRAEYVEKDKEVKTHIYWYMNNGTDAYKKYEDIAINQAVDIPAAPTRTGYVFRGWARINIGSTPEAAAAWEANSANWTQGTKTLFIVYTGTGYTNTSGEKAEYVAADEHTPYNAMFAVWDPILTVEIVGNTATKTYNGSEQNVEGFTVVYKLAGEEVEAPAGVTVALKDGSKAEAKGTDVATYPMGLTKDDFTVTVAENAGIVFDATDENSVTVTDGNLTIEPAKVTITAKDASRAYNGEALTQPEFTVTGLAEGDTHEFAVVMTEDSTITNVGTQPNVIATVDGVAVTTGTEKAVGNYLVTTADGTLTITPNTDEVTVTITGNHDSKVYNAAEQSVTGYTTDVGEKTITVELKTEGKDTAKGTDVGHYTMGLTEADFTVTSENYSNIKVVVVDGYLDITPITDEVTVTITGHNDTTKYDGKEYIVTGYDVTISNPLYKEADFELRGTAVAKRTDVGQTDMGLAADQFTNVSKNFTNVKFEVTDGYQEITKRTVTLTSATDSKTYDGTPLTNSNVTVSGDGFAEGEGATYDVTGSQTLVGSSANTFTYTLNEGTKADNYDIKTVEGTLTVTDEDVPDDLVVKKTAENKVYKLGEEVTFTVEATNIYAEPRTITLTEIEGVTLAKSTFENVPAGEKVTTTATYTITEADILKGSFTNTVTAKVGDLEKTATATVNTEKADPSLKVEKETTSTPENGSTYALGETITYKITVTNDGNLTITNIKVDDDLTGLHETIDKLEPGESKEFTTEYVVTEADILKGSVKNEATADGDNESEDPTDPGDDEVEDPTDKPDPSLKVEKETTSTPANGSTYALGETITYKITVTNDGNLTITNVKVDDELTGLHETIESLEPGESKVFTTEYVVTEEDILAGKVVNEATADGDNESDDPTDPGDDEVDDPTEDPKGHITITKVTTSTPANGSTYALDEEITYKITVTNDGNLTITNIKVVDELTGDEWTIASLAPGESKEFTAAHKVTEEDILAGEVLNVATATGTSPDPEEPDVPVEPGEDPEPTDEKDAKLTLTKETTSTPADGAYVLDEQITYKITAKNEGNVTLTNVKIVDELTGDEWTIDSLKPGESKSFDSAAYTVTVDDVVAGSVKNVATATATDPEGETVEAEAEVEDPTKKRDDNDVDPEPDPDDPGESMDADGKSITVVYDGKEHTVSASATVADSKIEYSTDGGATWTEEAPVRVDVGTTEFMIRATHPAYEDVVKEGYKLEVIPAPLTIKIDDKIKTQGDPDPEFTYTVEGLVEGETIPEGVIVLTRDPGEAVGTYPIHGSVVKFMARATEFKASNYDITFEEGTLTIERRIDDNPTPLAVFGVFSFYFISDTMLEKEGVRNDAYKSMINWAAENQEALGALALVGSGNLVKRYDDADAWKYAKDTLNTLADTLPYFNAAGRTDVNGDEMNYDAYTENGLCKAQNKHDDGKVWYQIFEEQHVMLVGLGYQKVAETDEEKEAQDAWIKYVNDAIAAHEDYFVILTLNDFVDAAGTLSAFGALVEERIVAENENVELILCGNAEGAVHWTKTYGERTVDAVMYNYQADEEKGLGFMKIITIDGDTSTITVATYSPVMDTDTYDESKPENDFFVIENAF